MPARFGSATPLGRLACLALSAICLAGCSSGLGRGKPEPGAAGAQLEPAERVFLADLRQLTFGGENAEAYWSFDGRQLSFQARAAGEGCDRIYRIDPHAATPRPQPVSSGHGATTCAHFFPGGHLLFASTHLAGDACPPRPDMTRGYVWALHTSYDIFAAQPDGTQVRRITAEKGYDAEATVCGRDGSIVFTSTRDGDLELYRMDRNGSRVTRLTNAPGYDGGAFFNRDCSKIVWRASRPVAGQALDEYRRLLAQGLVRPSKLELWTADADGSNAVQLTYLDAASFAPSFHPTQDLIIFSSNVGDSRGREFELWAIRPDGTGLRRITHAPGFDGFPHFSPDGRWLAFSSNRATRPGSGDTNVFVARWLGVDAAPNPERPEDRIARDIRWLADPAREGRGMGTRGLEQAGLWLESQLQQIGLEPAGKDGSFRQPFPVVTKAELGPSSRIVLAGKEVPRQDFSALGFSGLGDVEGELVLVGYGLIDQSLGFDDYAGLDVKGKIVLVRRFTPEGGPLADPAQKARAGDLRRKAWVARERGAKALMVVDWPLPPSPSLAAPAAAPAWTPPAEAPLLPPTPEGPGDLGIPVVMVRRAAVEPVMDRLSARKTIPVSLSVSLLYQKTDAFNLVGRIPAGQQPRRGTVIIGAHYDHLGVGGRGSLSPGSKEPHLGADDNASGTATVLEMARGLMAKRRALSRDVMVMLFSGEESGLLGSSHLVQTRKDLLSDTIAMLNLDMVGRLRANRVEVLGDQTAAEWEVAVRKACGAERVICVSSRYDHGASDQAAFYAAEIPVLHFFTGTHVDYHKPSDVAAKVNAAGAAAVGRVVEQVVLGLEELSRLTYRAGMTAPVRGDRRGYGASLGTIPDYAGPSGGGSGVLLAGVRPGGAAQTSGMKRGDVLIRLGSHEIRSVTDLGFALGACQPGQSMDAVVVREGKPLTVKVILQEAVGR